MLPGYSSEAIVKEKQKNNIFLFAKMTTSFYLIENFFHASFGHINFSDNINKTKKLETASGLSEWNWGIKRALRSNLIQFAMLFNRTMIFKVLCLPSCESSLPTQTRFKRMFEHCTNAFGSKLQFSDKLKIFSLISFSKRFDIYIKLEEIQFSVHLRK